MKILDFGIAKAIGDEAGDQHTRASLTGAGTAIGTVHYMSPEQARGLATIGPQSDQFSFGLILYELVTGQKAFARDSSAETLTAIIREDAAPLPADRARAAALDHRTAARQGSGGALRLVARSVSRVEAAARSVVGCDGAGLRRDGGGECRARAGLAHQTLAAARRSGGCRRRGYRRSGVDAVPRSTGRRGRPVDLSLHATQSGGRQRAGARVVAGRPLARLYGCSRWRAAADGA